MNYDEALVFLTNLTKFGVNLGLERISHLLGLLGNPHEHLRVVHVGGTNGKGSTAMMIARVLESAGYRVGLFTSPHLHSYTERYMVNRVPITEEKFAKLMGQLRPLLEEMVAAGREHPTEFEVCTALAFLYFFEEKVDYLVLEVGLGGAIDSTNVVSSPLVSVITNVAFDHMEYLGNTLAEIAAVKSGIIKRHWHVVTAARAPEALEVIRAKCRAEKATLLEVGKDILWHIEELSPHQTRFSLTSPWGEYPGLVVPLAGHYQVVNAATALGAVEILRHVHGVRVTPEHIREGFAATYWPARLELLALEPRVLVDVTHNHDGARALREALREIYTYRRRVLVIGMLGDKEREKVVRELAPLAATVIVTKPNSPRAGNWEELAEEARIFTDRVRVIESIPEAVEAALQEAGAEDLVCITGSFYMVAEARAYLRSQFGVPVAF